MPVVARSEPNGWLNFGLGHMAEVAPKSLRAAEIAISHVAGATAFALRQMVKILGATIANSQRSRVTLRKNVKSGKISPNPGSGFGVSSVKTLFGATDGLLTREEQDLAK